MTRGDPSRRLTVVVDDAGGHASIDEAVRICMAAGSVDAISILGSADGAGRACGIAADADLGMAAHLNAVEAPLLTMDPVPMAVLIAGGRSMAASVEREWRAQIERLLGMGAVLTRLDSHRHIHHLPGLDSLFIRLAADYGIGKVRAAILPRGDRIRRPEGFLLHLLGRRLAAKAVSAGLQVPACMAGFGASGRLSRGYLESLVLPDGECELVTHPSTGRVWSGGQVGELELLTSDWFKEWTRGRRHSC